MKNTNTPIERFFDAFARHTAMGDVPELVASYADVFLAGSPKGAMPVRASDFAVALPKRYQLFETMGCRNTELIGLQENWLDARYVAVRTQWRMTFERPGAESLPVAVESTFLIDGGAEPFRILVYLAHTDIMDVLKHHGINPV